jgi:hypothetical protein
MIHPPARAPARPRVPTASQSIRSITAGVQQRQQLGGSAGDVKQATTEGTPERAETIDFRGRHSAEGKGVESVPRPQNLGAVVRSSSSNAVPGAYPKAARGCRAHPCLPPRLHPGPFPFLAGPVFSRLWRRGVARSPGISPSPPTSPDMIPRRLQGRATGTQHEEEKVTQSPRNPQHPTATSSGRDD